MLERAAAAPGGEDDNGGVGEPVTVKIAKGDRVAVNARVVPFRCTLAIGD